MRWKDGRRSTNVEDRRGRRILGGAKGGVRINPKNMTKEDLEKVSREYIRAFHEVVGENKDVPAPDVYTNAQIMSWMLDEYESIYGRCSLLRYIYSDRMTL